MHSIQTASEERESLEKVGEQPGRIHVLFFTGCAATYIQLSYPQRSRSSIVEGKKSWYQGIQTGKIMQYESVSSFSLSSC
jgi:hypothetical protein